MFKKTLLTAAALLAITAGATTLSAPEAQAGVKFSINLGHGYYGGFGGHYGNHGYYGPSCQWHQRRVRVTYWHNGHKHKKWVWRSFRTCY